MAGFDDFDTITMLEAFETIPPVPSFFRDHLFPGDITFDTEAVQVDFYYGKQRMAPFVWRYQGGRILPRDGFETQLVTPPKFAPTRVLPADDLLFRGIGESAYNALGPTERAARYLLRDQQDCDQSISRREEWECAQVLTTGGLVIDADEGGQFKLMYTPHAQSNTPLPWTDPTSLPLNDLAQLSADIRHGVGYNGDFCVMAGDAASAFLSNPQVKAYYHILNYVPGVIEPSAEGVNTTYLGRLTLPFMDVYVYDDYYYTYAADGTETEMPMMPSGCVIVTTSQLKGTMLYGGISQYESENSGIATTYRGRRVPLIFTDIDSQVRKYRLSARPLPLPKNGRAWSLANVLAKGDASSKFPYYDGVVSWQYYAPASGPLSEGTTKEVPPQDTQTVPKHHGGSKHQHPI
jgi:hypothetical protein